MKQFLLLLCLLAAAESQTSTESRKDGEERASDITSGLYMTLRDIAFPNHKLSDPKPVDSRFLMLMPGKVLNYFDYYPGGDYTSFIQVSKAAQPATSWDYIMHGSIILGVNIMERL